jgi:hypothetical protein
MSEGAGESEKDYFEQWRHPDERSMRNVKSPILDTPGIVL